MSLAPQEHVSEATGIPQPDAQLNKPDRTVQHSRTYTPGDRPFLKKLKISTDGIEFKK